MDQNKKNQIISKLEIVSILDYKNKLQKLFPKCFDTSEIEELNNKSIQTILGFFALKTAVKKILNEINPKINIIDKNIIISHNALGAPILKKINSSKVIYLSDKIHISLSHTKNNVYGLAVLGNIRNGE